MVCVVVSPSSDRVLPSHVVSVPLLLVCWCVCCGWGSAVGCAAYSNGVGVVVWCCVVEWRRRVFASCEAVFYFSSPCLCVCCHSIVDLGWCLCGRVVSLWNGGVGCVVSIHRSCCGVCFSVMVCVGRNGGVCGVCSPQFSFFLSLCCGVRGSARAALRARTLSPNTIVFPLCVLSCSLFSSSLLFHHPLFFCCGMAVCVLPCVGVLCWHDGDG